VIYEENHSFDNLYGSWGRVGRGKVVGLKHAKAGTTQVDQAGSPISCLFQNDANLITTSQTTPWIDGSVHPGRQTPLCTGTLPNPPPTNPTGAFDSHFTSSKPFKITKYVKPADATCAPPNKFMAFGVEKGDPGGLPGGCTRDLVHRFYQEQYQLDHGKQDRYSTGSDAVGLTQGTYRTKKLPVYQYLHKKKAPNYVIADHLFQAAFGGSFLNHQWLIAAASPQWDTTQSPVPGTANSRLDAAGFPNASATNGVPNYPLYKPIPGATYNDGPLTQACGPTAVPGFACGNYAVNTVQPTYPPKSASGTVLPGINDVDPSKPFYETNIGDEMTAKGVSWSWYAGGWNNAVAGTPDPLFQYHHQPFNYFQNYAPGMPGRAHLKDEADFFAAAKAGKLPTVSFVKPIGEENEHPGYASTHNGESHLVKLIKSILKGPDGKDTLIVVTYDEFGGQWDHMAPPGQGIHASKGVHDQMGPGTRIPALIIGGHFTHSGVDHTYLDTTSIIATIEHAFGLAPLSTRDAQVSTLKNTLKIGRRGHR
jgi:phospholipase C